MKFSYLLKYTLAFIALAIVNPLNAQTNTISPEPERDVFFYYSEGKLVNDERVKILMISQYIYRSKYSFHGYKEVFGFDGGDFGTVITAVTNATSERLEEIEKNEYNSKSKNRFHQIQFNYPKFVQASYGFDKVTCFCPVNSNEPNEYDNTTSSFLFKCRGQLIAEYLKKGYKIILFESDELFERQRFAEEANLERISPLSGLLYEYYDKGDILKLTDSYQENENEENSEYEAPSISKFCLDKTSYIKTIYDQASNSLNWSDTQLWNRVKLACEDYFSSCGNDNYLVNNIYNTVLNRNLNIVNGFLDAGSTMANDIFTPYTIYGFGYIGLNPSDYFDSTSTFKKYSFQLSGVKKFVNAIGEVGYIESPQYSVGRFERDPYSDGWLKVNEEQYTRKGALLSFGVGPSFRFLDDHIILNGLGQFGAMFYKKNFEDEMGLEMILNWSAGIIFRFGKFGIGANYNSNFFPSPMEVGETIESTYNFNDDDYYYEVTKPYPKIWSGLELRLLYNFKIDK